MTNELTPFFLSRYFLGNPMQEREGRNALHEDVASSPDSLVRGPNSAPSGGFYCRVTRGLPYLHDLLR